ncbi:hypothetical protein Agabi119p4_7685 [Agaricus bisporus var. burnettii]|uniref:Uncharacterized protein n=1 Tax=Agaricus bisporus var. burnettii TaxID=192524 RepID=A0A8H7EZH5_AGABI|nr:hypothetical protein Agabi119p4_7685 [Agaricus bisporus var. burnettii]
MHSQAIPTIGTIRYLSTFLAQTDFRNSEPSKGKHLSSGMRFLGHISTMLSLGVSNGLGVAVTGQLEKDGAKAIIVVSKNSYHSSGQEPFHIEPTSVTATKFEPKEIQYLTKEYDKPVSFVQHVQDLIGVLEMSRKSEVHPMHVAHWLVHRCHRKLSSRLQHLEREWKMSPTATMKVWEPTDLDRKYIESQARTLDILEGKPYQVALKKAHITTITLDSVKSAKMFICGMANLIDLLHELLGAKRSKESKFEDIEDAFMILMTLEVILDEDTIHHIITKSSLSNNFQPRNTYDEGRFLIPRYYESFLTKTIGTTQSAEMESEFNVNDSEDLDDYDDEVAGTSQFPDETGGEQVFRYMRTLTAWITASRVVIGALRKLGKTLSASIVTLGDYSSEALSQMEELQDDIMGQLKAELADSTWLDRQGERLRKSLVEGTVKAPHVHAEAGLMALAKVARDGTLNLESQEVKEVFMADPVLIGVSKKCCYMCSLLGQALSAGDNDDFNNVNMQLPGTHGHMFSWDPPQFGVSQSVLDGLANNLKQEVIKVAERNAPDQIGTQQSSPASSNRETTCMRMSEDIPGLPGFK